MDDCLRAGKLSYYVTSHPVQLSLPFSGVGKCVLVLAIAGKAKADMTHSDCGWTCGCAGKTMRSLQNICYTWALLRWWFTKRRYTNVRNFTLYLYFYQDQNISMAEHLTNSTFVIAHARATLKFPITITII